MFSSLFHQTVTMIVGVFSSVSLHVCTETDMSWSAGCEAVFSGIFLKMREEGDVLLVIGNARVCATAVPDVLC